MFNGTISYANTTLSLVEITQDTLNYRLGSNAIIIPDKGKNYTVQNIISLVDDGDLPKKNGQNTVKLNDNKYAHWVVIRLNNNTDKHQWILDFGDLHEGQSGVADKLLIYETTQKEILYNRLQHNRLGQMAYTDKSSIDLTLPKNNVATLIIYILPDEQKPFQFVPSLIENDAPGFYALFDIYKILDDHLVTILMLSFVTILIGFSLTRGVGYIAILLYYCMVALWFYGFESAFISNNFILYALSPFLNQILSLIILLATFFTVPERHSTNWARFPLIFIAVANVTGLVVLSIFPENLFSPLSYKEAATAVALITQIMCVLYLINVKTPSLKTFSYCLAVWVALLTIGQIIVMLASFNFIEMNYLTLYADRLSLYPQFVFLLVGMILSVHLGHNHILKKAQRDAKRAQTVISGQKGKETIDNSRLLRVIEREREVMEELRARESERTEEMREAKETADEASQAKSAFLAVVSHEIRTPMTGMIGMLRMLEKTNLTGEQREYLEVVKDSSDTMLALLNDILDFSKIEQGGLSFETIEFDLRRVMNTVKTLMKTYADQKNVALNVTIDDRLGRIYYGDPTRLRQVLLNLVGNALKFTDNGHVHISALLDNQNINATSIRFVIEDSGIGISEEAQKNLFKPFSQADSSISRKYGGTGLGLVICKTLVNAMGGDITVKSQENIGTSFEFTVPFQNQENASSTTALPTPETNTDFAAMDIMVIDDNDVNLRLINGYLKEFGHTPYEYASAKDALDDLKKNIAIHIIFVDIEMPDMNGLEFAKAVLSDTNLKAIPIIAMTGNVGEKDLATYQDTGFKGVIEKPFDPDVIQNFLQNIAQDKNYSNFEPKEIIEEDPKKPTRKKKKIPTGKALNEDALINLKNGLGTEKLKELLDDLFQTSHDIIFALYEAIANNDGGAIKARTHELRGMAANFGLSAISEKATELEKLAGDPDYKTEDFSPHITDLETLVERSKIACDTFFE